MQCERCGRELAADGHCQFCEAEEEARVRVMTRAEKRDYQGVTLEEDGGAGEDIRFERRQNPWGGIRWTSVRAASWTDRLLVIAIVAAVLAFVVFVALPVALFVVFIGAAGWLLTRILSV